MGRHKDSLRWSLQLRSKTYFVYHRFNLEGKLVGKTTGEQDKEKALKKALEIVCEARAALIQKTEGEDYPHSFADAVEELRVEEEKLLGNELDKTNPRLDTLWKLGDTYKGDAGLLRDWVVANKTRAVQIQLRGMWKLLRKECPNLKRINEVKPAHIEQCLEAKRTPTNHQTMVCYFQPTFRSLFKILIEMGWYHSENPVPKIKVNHNLIQKKEVQALTEKEVQAIQKVCDEYGGGYDVFLKLVTETGMRRGEAANLLWSEVHLDAQPHPYLEIKPHAADPALGIVESTTKTRNSVRIVPIRKALYDFLLPIQKDSGYVVEQTRHHWDRWAFRIPLRLDEQIKEVCPRFHPHLLRHTFISKALMAGVPPVKVSKWVGDSLATILGTYTHFIPDGDINNF